MVLLMNRRHRRRISLRLWTKVNLQSQLYWGTGGEMAYASPRMTNRPAAIGEAKGSTLPTWSFSTLRAVRWVESSRLVNWTLTDFALNLLSISAFGHCLPLEGTGR